MGRFKYLVSLHFPKICTDNQSDKDRNKAPCFHFNTSINLEIAVNIGAACQIKIPIKNARTIM